MPNDHSSTASPDRPSSTASSSLYRRHGISPRQRRLLQAAARARVNNTNNSSPRRQTEQCNVSPSRITPASLTTSLSPIEHSTPDDETVENLTRSSPKKTLSSSLEKISHKFVGNANATDATTVSSTAATDATTVSIGSRFSQLRLNPVNDDGEVMDAMRGTVSDRVRRFNGGIAVNKTTFKRLNEEDENDTEEVTRRPLNKQNNVQASRIIQPKLVYQKQQPNPEGIRHGWKNDILKTAAKQMELRYYRITYPGVVSLLSDLPGAAATTNVSTKSDAKTNEPSVYLGHGEIVATSSPEVTISLPELKRSGNTFENQSTSHTVDPENKFIRAIRIDLMLTGGYNLDDKECIASDPSVPASWKNSTIRHHGYLLLDNQFGETIAELIPPTKPGSIGPSYERGTFVYRVRASSPVRVLSGPDLNSPSMKYALLPGTIHDVSFRVSVPISNSNDNDADVLVDDADAGEIKFLKLGHRRGWVADRRVDAVDGDSKRLRVSYLMQDVTEEQNLNNTCSGTSFAGSPNSTISQSLDCSSLNLSVNASSVATPTTVNSQRKRTRRRRREARNAPIILQGNRHPGESFDTESSAAGYGSGTVVSAGADSLIDQRNGPSVETYYLMRVLAPLGLKILDAPHFQVSELIHTPTEHNKLRNQSPAGISPFARTNAMIGSSSADNSPSSAGVHRKGQRIRFLARGQFFEASNRMESTDAASLYTNGQGLVKLADGSGWVIIPHRHDLLTQYENFRGGTVDPNEVVAFEELGDATIQKQSGKSNLTPPDRLHQTSKSVKPNHQPVSWLRIVSPNGVKVLLPPATFIQRKSQQLSITPPKYPTPGEKSISIKPSSSSQDSEIASAVSSSFFDSVWSRVTPTKQKNSVSSGAVISIAPNKHTPSSQNQTRNLQQHPVVPVIPCGMVVPVEYSDSESAESSERHFVRLFNGQGWIPHRVAGTTCTSEVGTPDARFGSFWFRVKSTYGLDVRHGPASYAPYITSDCGHSFRFECGEFLRASEVLTVFHKGCDGNGSFGSKMECFARLYRKNQGLNNDPSCCDAVSRYYSIQSLSSPGEWVMVCNSDELLLEECSMPPLVERNCEGWRCSAIQNVHIRSGPSFNARRTTKVIQADEEFLVSEKVMAAGESIVWFRLKNGEGWVHSAADNGDAVVHCHINISQSDFSRKLARNIINR